MQDKNEKTIEFLKINLNPSFVYTMEETGFEPVLHIMAMFESAPDVFSIGRLESQLSEIAGIAVQLYHVDECDADFIGEVLEYGDMIYCRDDMTRRRFLGGYAQKCAEESMKRGMLISRMEECASIYEQ